MTTREVVTFCIVKVPHVSRGYYYYYLIINEMDVNIHPCLFIKMVFLAIDKYLKSFTNIFNYIVKCLFKFTNVLMVFKE
jgi:hypothetical protein